MRALIQMFALMTMLFLGIFLGIDAAEKNIHDIQGTKGATRAIQVIPQKGGKIEITVLGNVVETPNPINQVNEQKVKEVTEMVKTESNRLAHIGNEVGSGLRNATRGIVESLVSLKK